MAGFRRFLVRFVFVIVSSSIGAFCAVVVRGWWNGSPKDPKPEHPQVVEKKPEAQPSVSPGEKADTVNPPAEVYLVGWAKSGSKINVVLSDGRIYTEGHPDLQGVSRTWAIVAGKTFWLRAPAPSVAQAPGVGASSLALPSSKVETSTPSTGARGPSAGSWLLDNDGVYRLR